MVAFSCRHWLLGLLASVNVVAANATGHERAVAPGTGFRSAMDGYRPFAEQPVEPWVATNEVVRQVGGWRAYAAERSASPAPTPQGAAQAASPRVSGHEGRTNAPAGHGSETKTDPHAGHGSKK